MLNTEIEIVLIEDNKNEAELTIQAIRKSRIANKIFHFKNGTNAIDFLFGKGEFEHRNIDNLPRVILLDLKMPKMDVIQVLERVKGDDQTMKIPVVVLTSSKEHPDIKRAYSFGANSYIVKPVDFDGFTRAILELGFYWILVNQPPPE
jgi:two-component system, response regulator